MVLFQFSISFDHKRDQYVFVVDTGIEPVTPSMSRKCATAAPIDHLLIYFEVETGFEPVGLQLCRLLLWAAQPLHHA